MQAQRTSDTSDKGDKGVVRRTRPAFADNVDFASMVDDFAERYTTVGEMVYAVIRRAVVDGTFAAGEWLRQDSLAAAIGVSRIPVRSALIQLDSEGLVSYHPYKGALVSTLSEAQIDEIYRLRTLLEPYALRLAMPRFDVNTVAVLRELAGELDVAEEGHDFVEARVRFFHVLYDAARSPLLVQLIEDLRAKVGRYLLGLRIGNHTDGDGRHDSGSHSALVDLVAEGDLSGAERWIVEHHETVRRRLIATIHAANS